jgi:dihydropyrimidinase
MIEGMQSDPVDLVITGGSVVNADWHGPAGVCVSAGKVSHLVQPGSPLPELSPGARVIDAGGLLVMPGGVDPHTHVNLAIGAWTTRDDYEQASRAAIWGGTTTLIDFAIPVPGQTPLEAVRERRAAAETAHCDTALHGCVIDWDHTVPAQIAAMAEAGVRTIKMFTTYRDTVMAEPLTVLRVMQAISEVGGMAVVHAESDHVLAETQERMAATGRIDAGHHAETRSVLAEVSAVREVLDIAEHLGVPVYFVHQSDAEAVAAVRSARHRGVRAYSETCPHYLTLDSSASGRS